MVITNSSIVLHLASNDVIRTFFSELLLEESAGHISYRRCSGDKTLKLKNYFPTFSAKVIEGSVIYCHLPMPK